MFDDLENDWGSMAITLSRSLSLTPVKRRTSATLLFVGDDYCCTFRRRLVIPSIVVYPQELDKEAGKLRLHTRSLWQRLKILVNFPLIGTILLQMDHVQ